MSNLLSKLRATGTATLALFAVLLAACIWAYWSTLTAMGHVWQQKPEYSHGFLVPLFALFLLWRRAPECKEIQFEVSWLGALLIGIGCGLRVTSSFIYFEWLDGISFLVCVAGLVGMLGGRRLLSWTWPAIAFMAFMIPLPFRLEIALAFPLRRIATIASTYALQTLGFTAFAQGNVIFLNDHRIGIAEACSGISMLLVFFALATGMAMMIQRSWLEKAIIVLSALPIAIIANLVRIVVTATMYVTVGGRAAEVFFHDVAGWLMMPFALGVLMLELYLLSKLLQAAPSSEPVPLVTASPPVTSPIRSSKKRDKKSRTVSQSHR